MDFFDIDAAFEQFEQMETNSYKIMSMEQLLEIFGCKLEGKKFKRQIFKNNHQQSEEEYEILFNWEEETGDRGGTTVGLSKDLNNNVFRIRTAEDLRLNYAFKNQRTLQKNYSHADSLRNMMGSNVLNTELTYEQLSRVIQTIKQDAPNRKHIAFCFASPLTKPKSAISKNRDLDQLKFKEEFQDIQNSLKETGKSIKFFKCVATYTNFGDMLANNPYVLHFSGHGVTTHFELLNNQKPENGHNGDYLIIEDEYCGGYEMNCNMLKSLLEKAKININVAVVLSCHSQFIGEMFLKAGVEHVICVGSKYKVQDNACIKFAKAFYKGLFDAGSKTVCEAFELAKSMVRMQFGRDGIQKEENKFKCLHKHQNESDCRPIDIVIQNGNVVDCSNKSQVKRLPFRTSEILGRHSDCSKIIKSLLSHSIVWIEGRKGIGKSATVKEISHLIFERDVFEDGVIYMPLRDCDFLENLIEQMFIYLAQSFTSPKAKKDLETFSSNEVSEKYNKCITMISNLKLLIIFDDCDPIIHNELGEFQKLIEDFAQRVQNSTLLFTSKVAIDGLERYNYEIIRLQPLPEMSIFDLLLKKVKSKENFKNELLELQNKTRKESQKTNEINLEHDIFRILNGNPLSAILVASLYQDASISEIYKTLTIFKREERTSADMEETIFSLNLKNSMKFVKKLSAISYQIILAFALSPSGLSRTDLRGMFQYQEKDLKIIQEREFSLSRSKNTDHSEPSFCMEMSIMDSIRKLADIKDLEKIDKIIVEHIVKDLMHQIGNATTSPQSEKYFIINFEGNIWAALSRMKNKFERDQQTLNPLSNLTNKDGITFNMLGNGIIKYIQNKDLISKAKNMVYRAKKGNYMSKKSQLMDKCFFAKSNKIDFGDSLTSNALSAKKGREAKNRNLLRTFAKNLLNEEEQEEAKKLAEKYGFKADNTSKVLHTRSKLLEVSQEESKDDSRQIDKGFSQSESSSTSGEFERDTDEVVNISSGLKVVIENTPTEENVTDTKTNPNDSSKKKSFSAVLREEKKQEISVSSFNMGKEPEVEVENSSDSSDKSPFCQQLEGSLPPSQLGTFVKPVYELGLHDKLAILFSTVLCKNNHLDSALKVIEQYALDCSINKLSHANAVKIKTILMLEDESESFINIKACCDLALKKFSRVKSILGCAICHLLQIIILTQNIRSPYEESDDGENEDQGIKIDKNNPETTDYHYDNFYKRMYQLLRIKNSGKTSDSYKKIVLNVKDFENQTSTTLFDVTGDDCLIRKFILTPILNTKDEKMNEFQLEKIDDAKITQLIQRLKQKEIERTCVNKIQKKYYSKKVEIPQSPLLIEEGKRNGSEKIYSGGFLNSVSSTPKVVEKDSKTRLHKYRRESDQRDNYNSGTHLFQIKHDRLQQLKSNSDIFKQSPVSKFNAKYSQMKIPQSIGKIVPMGYSPFVRSDKKNFKSPGMGGKVNKTQAIIVPRTKKSKITKQRCRSRAHRANKTTHPLRVKGSKSYVSPMRKNSPIYKCSRTRSPLNSKGSYDKKTYFRENIEHPDHAYNQARYISGDKYPVRICKSSQKMKKIPMYSLYSPPISKHNYKYDTILE
ncbi:unnamed protein product [Moneuplotes crassus]|uniref:CHAT domain-containing protein n=1 Tax=Euplotes crassus TaxID=5936 RepID=A0AAD1Y208_EUPCR|nr:unnamed protein product [Moneuplotes crassus]